MDVFEVTRKARALWGLGDYGAMAVHFEPVARELVDRAAIGPGHHVIDVAAGTGNVAVEAARRGAMVEAVDLTPELVERGRARTERLELPVTWQEGNAEALPAADGAFDAALSALGVMFAPRPSVAATELVRVVRPGGVVGVANWRASAFASAVGEVLSRHSPSVAPPRPVTAWADEDGVRRLLGPAAASMRVTTHVCTTWWRSPEAWAALAERSAPPMVSVRQELAEDDWPAVRAELVDAVAAIGRHDGERFVIDHEYLVAVAVLRDAA